MPTAREPLRPIVLRLALLLLYATGLRRGELQRLTPGDDGAEVQVNLPKLALYMGHVSIVSTAYYLRWMPAVVARGSDRFGRVFGQVVEGGAS